MNETVNQTNTLIKYCLQGSDQKFIQYIMKKNLFLLKDLLELYWNSKLYKREFNLKGIFIDKLDHIINKHNKIVYLIEQSK